MSTLTENVEKVKELLGNNGEHWTQGAFVRDIEGKRLVSLLALNTQKVPGEAYAYCLSGAVFKTVETEKEREKVFEIFTDVAFSYGKESIEDFNDCATGFYQIKEFLEKAHE